MNSNTRKYSKLLRKEQTEAERLLWSHLRNKQCRGVKFRRQQALDAYVVDFVSFDEMLIIEIDGGQHNMPEIMSRDKIRLEYFEHEGYRILRFWNNEVLQNIEGVIARVTEHLG